MSLPRMGARRGMNPSALGPQAPAEATLRLDFLLDQAKQGIHHVFERDELLSALQDREMEIFISTHKDAATILQSLLTEFLEQPTLPAMRAHYDRLTPENKRMLVVAYMRLVEMTVNSDFLSLH